MFRKLVSNLPFSPALVGQLGFYARRLRKEEVTRRTGMIITILALIVQSFTVFVPSTSANPSHASDLIRGGVDSISELLKAYDSNKQGYKDIMNYAGITRDEIKSMKKTTINSRDYGTSDGRWLSWGRVSRMSAAKGEVKHDVNGTAIYSRPLWRLDTTSWTKVHGSTYTAFVGHSEKMGRFAILLDCGNLVTRKNPPTEKITVCRPGVGIITIKSSDKKSTDLPADSDQCSAITITENKFASNLTQGVADASKATARASDRIEYKLTMTNKSKVPASATFKEELDDVLEYATVQDTGGGTFDQSAKTLTWPTVNLAAGEKQTRTFVITVMSTIPSTARGKSEPSSYDCIMNNTFGDNVQIAVQCDTPKIVEETVAELPHTGPTENMIFAGSVLAIVSYFWARSRQLNKEVRLVRKDFSGSTI